MRLILLIVGLTACVSAHKLDFWKELRISNAKMEQFKEDLGGIDLEQRYLKLRNLASRNKVAKLSEEQEMELKQRTSMIKKTIIEKPLGVNATDLLEVNEQSGIANFLYQGDINLTEEQLNQITKSANGASRVDGSRVKRGAAVLSADKWTNGIVYYYLDASIRSNQAKVDAINAAIQLLQTKTGIRFQYSRVNTNRLRIIDGGGCWSSVGMLGGEQDLSIGDGCEIIGIVAHELAHALGFKHMQSRYDRDDYVTVDSSAIEPDKLSQFQKLTVDNSINYTPFEYGGMMQYRVNSFGINGSFTMAPKDIKYLHTMGSSMISFYDVKMINDFYGYSANCPLATSAKCQNGGLPNPNNCQTCYCPLGYAGTLCDRMPSASGGCGAELTATPTWQSKTFELGENNQVVRNVYTECHHWIKAPVGSKIEVRINAMRNPQCNYGCLYNGIEFKLKDQQMTNPKICCNEFLNEIYTSELNPLPVIAHNLYEITRFTIEYRYVGGTATPKPEVRTTTKEATTPKPEVPTTTKEATTPKPEVPTTTKVVTTPKPEVRTTTKESTTTTASSGNCEDRAYCATYVRQGLCTSNKYSFQEKKYNCAKSCNLCGKKANPCVDLKPEYICDWYKSNGECQSLPPLTAEYHCAATCGFCEHPN